MIAISAVVPVFRNEATLEALAVRIAAVLERATDGFEIVFVDDASPDGSLAVLRALAARDARVAVVALAANAGQNRAVVAGLAEARGRVVVVLDADLQDPPEAIPALVNALAHGAGAAFGGRRGRYESIGRLVTSKTFKALLFVASRGRLPRDAGLFVAMTAEAARRVVADAGDEPYVPAALARSGLPLVSVPVERAVRGDGAGSAYTGALRAAVAVRALRALLAGPRRGTGAPGARVREFVGARFTSGSRTP